MLWSITIRSLILKKFYRKYVSTMFYAHPDVIEIQLIARMFMNFFHSLDHVWYTKVLLLTMYGIQRYSS